MIFHPLLSLLLFTAATIILTAATVSTSPAPAPPSTLLSIAATKDNFDEISALLQAGSDPNALTSDGESVLHLVCIWGGPKKVALLLAAGADPNARATKHKTSLDMTPLSWCSYAGYAETIAEFLQDERTNVNLIVKQENGQCITAMDIAIKIGAERGEATQEMLKAAGGAKYEELQFWPSDKLAKLLPPSGCPA